MYNVWDTARGSRPSIYGPPRKSMTLRYFGNTEDSIEAFGRYFRDLVKKARPEHPLKAYELCRTLCLAEPLGLPIITISGISLRTRLAGSLVLRDLYLTCKEPDEERAADFALSNHDKERFPFAGMPVEDLARLISMQIRADASEVEYYLGSFYPGPKTQHIESTYYVDCCLLETLAGRFRPERQQLFFEYPVVLSKLVAVLGADGHSSFFANFDRDGMVFTPFSHPEIRYMGGVELPEAAAVSVRIMSPWESDEVEKAGEIASRGIPVSRPLGRLFVDGIEFGLFEWVSGKTLDRLRQPEVWEAYGRLLRLCHERGIALDDAAGRNAVWNGEEVRLLDLEHTWLKKEAGFLDYRHRKPALKRIEKETGGDQGVFDAFMRGYGVG